MKDIILATHGNLSYEFKKTAELIVGPIKNVNCFGMTKDKSSIKAKEEIEAMISSVDESNLIVLTDLFGGSATNIFTELLLQGHHFTLLSGLNLPMLLTLLTTDSADLSTSDLVNQLKNAGIAGIVDVGEKVREGVENNA